MTADDQVIEVDSWLFSLCKKCEMSEMEAHEYSDGSVRVICPSCGDTRWDGPDATALPEVQP